MVQWSVRQGKCQNYQKIGSDPVYSTFSTGQLFRLGVILPLNAEFDGHETGDRRRRRTDEEVCIKSSYRRMLQEAVERELW